jgi:hypothetical protein
MSRNHPLTFSANTDGNLRCIRAARLANDPTVHEVTQIANSLLGLIVFPFEKGFIRNSLKELRLDQLVADGWPNWQFEPGSETETLGELICHLRNAAAHGRMKFCSDSREPSEVPIKIEDWKQNAKAAYWKASIVASDLQTFCEKLIKLLEAQVSN